MAGAKQIMNNKKEDMEHLFNDIPMTEGHAELWLMWKEADGTRWINFGKYFFANKTTIKNIPDSGLWVGVHPGV